MIRTGRLLLETSSEAPMASFCIRLGCGLPKQRENFNAKEEYFLRNGAILLEKQISSYQGKGEPLRIFSAKDIKRATNNYDSRLILGRAVATVYKGTLDDRPVAIKTPRGLHPTDDVIDFFLNQVTTKLQITHKNVLKLFGCCLETQIPILVYEFMPNGTLSDHLQGSGGVGLPWIAWPERLRIATEIAYVLSYMHCAKSKPIVHRDVKSSNVFVDENYTAKLSNFGFSVSISPDDEAFSKLPIAGTWGYIDPEYLQTQRITEKCDVYGFGVVLVELFTGKVSSHMSESNTHSVEQFVSSMKEKRILPVVETRILEEGSMEQIQAFAELALRCVGEKGEERPTMREVVLELRRIRYIT